MMIGVTVTIVSGLIGITIGVLGGFFGGRVDDVVLFAITTRLSMPVVLVALAVVGAARQLDDLLVITLGLLLWDRFAVVARATTMQVRNLDFVAAAWCAGCSRFRILSREVLPNIASHLVVVATLEIALAILLEAALSFLGLGVPPPLPSWGLMIAEAKDYMFFSPWVIVIPGVGAVRAGARHQPAGRRAARPVRREDRSVSALLEVDSSRSSFGGRVSAVRGASLHRRARRDPLPGGRVGLRQVGDRARRHEPAGARRRARGRAARLRGRGPARADRRRHGAAARQRAWP